MLENKRKFAFENIDEVNSEIKEINLQADEEFKYINDTYKIGDFELPNRFVALPMEGVDAVDGYPSQLTIDKYRDIAKGGYGLVWVEATSVNLEGRSNDNQLYINDDNFDKFEKLNNIIKSESLKSSYKKECYTVLQLNHSGRYSNVSKKENSQIATHRPDLDKKRNIEEDRDLVTDLYLDQLKEDYLRAAILSKKAGFDAVDIKACHGYLLSELLSAKDRKGKYGGSFENRIRFLMDTIDLIQKNEMCKGLDIVVRLNMADMTKNGFATTENLNFDLDETIRLIKLLREKNIKIISLTLGNPYFISYMNKPSDLKKNDDIESPFVSEKRIFEMTSRLQGLFPDINFVGLGYTFFRQFGANIAENQIRNNNISLAGFGRQILSYPDMPNDINENKKMDSNKVCITCNLCSTLKSNFLPTGCAVRNSKVYTKYVKELKS